MESYEAKFSLTPLLTGPDPNADLAAVQDIGNDSNRPGYDDGDECKSEDCDDSVDLEAYMPQYHLQPPDSDLCVPEARCRIGTTMPNVKYRNKTIAPSVRFDVELNDSRAGFSPYNLLFTTLTASYSIKQPIPQTLSYLEAGPHRLYDRDSSACGFVHIDGDISTCHTLFKFAVLSYTAPGHVQALQDEPLRNQGRYAPRTRDDSIDGEEVAGQWHEWEFFNVIPLESQGLVKLGAQNPLQTYKRVGRGIIHRDALLCETAFGDGISLETIVLA
jgi:hypothetical protein